MDERDTLWSQREEEQDPQQKPRDENVLHRHQQRITGVSVGAGVMLLLTIITVSFFLTHPPKQPVAVTPATVNSQATRTSATVPRVQVQALPCTVNLRTWTDGSSDWQIRNGVLFNGGTKQWDGSGGPTIVAPCDVSSASAWSSTNVAIETRIQVIGAQDQACFGVTVRGSLTLNGWQGYKAGVGNCLGGLDGTRVSGPDYLHDAQAHEAAFHPGTTSHTYRIEIADTTIQFFIDGRRVLNVYDPRYLTGAEIGLWCQHVQLAVTSFKVTSLDAN